MAGRIFTPLTLLLSIIYSLQLWAQSQPPQPGSGPGGSDYTYDEVVMLSYEAQHDGFYIFEPRTPMPDSANVVVFIHGLSLVNPKLYSPWIKHLVRKGNIVIYPKYQDAPGTTPEADYNNNTIHAIVEALDTLQNQPGHVRPRLQNFAVAGHSYGGLMTANMGILAATSGFPVPKCLLVCQPYNDSGTNVRLPDYSIMPADMNMLIMIGEDDLIVGNTFGRFLMDSTTNTSTAHKNYITHHADNHGSSGIGASHFEPCSKDGDFDTGESNLFTVACDLGTKTDAVDYYAYWKLLDALMDCSFYGENCEYAFGDTPEQHGMGQWSDGQTVIPMTVEPAAPSSVHELDAGVDFKIYPNPASDKLLLNLNGLDKVQLEIIDMLGKVVYQKTIVNQMIFDLDLHFLEKGTYTIRIIEGNKVGASKLLIQ